MSRPLPDWYTGEPEKSGIYVGFSDDPSRTDGADLYVYNAETRKWKHHTGWYDHLITHWIFITSIDND